MSEMKEIKVGDIVVARKGVNTCGRGKHEVLAILRDKRGAALTLKRPDGSKHHNVPIGDVEPAK